MSRSRIGETISHEKSYASGVEKWFTDLPPVRIAMEAGTHSIWTSEQLQELGHEVIVANVRGLPD
jgi:transposase